MTARREFPRKIKAAIIYRAMNAEGQIVCEGCGLVLGKKLYHIDHTIPEELLVYKGRQLTAEDGKLLGWACCHKPKTAVDVGQIAKAERRRMNHIGIPRRKGPPMQGSKASRWKKPFNGPAVLR